MPILQSAASNVESTLAFNLSGRLVEVVRSLQGSAAQNADPRDSTLFLCIGILFLSAAPLWISSQGKKKKKAASVTNKEKGTKQHLHLLGSAARVGRDMLSLASEVLLLAFSRLVMQQVGGIFLFLFFLAISLSPASAADIYACRFTSWCFCSPLGASFCFFGC